MEKDRKIKALLVDDEVDVLSNLSFLLGKFCQDIEIIGLAKNVDDALGIVQIKDPEVVFLDIEMPGKDGFDFLDQLSERSFELIFVTSYNQHAIRAFRYSALDYLLKPIDIDDLKEAVDRVSLRISTHQESTLSIELIKEALSGSNPSKIALPTHQGTHLTPISDIIYIEADGSYCTVCIAGQNSLMLSKNLKEYEDLLQTAGFHRVHYSYLVNMNHIVKFSQLDGGSLSLSNNKIIPVSRRRKALFESRLKQFLGS